MADPPLGRRWFLASTGVIGVAVGCSIGDPPPPPSPTPSPSPSLPPDALEVIQGRTVQVGRLSVGFVNQFGDRVSLSIAAPDSDRFETTAFVAGPQTLALDGSWWAVESAGIANGRSRLVLRPADPGVPPPAAGQRLLYPGGWARGVDLPRLKLAEVTDEETVMLERWVDPHPGPDDPGRRTTAKIGTVVQTASTRYTVAGLVAPTDALVGHLALTAEAAGE